MKNTIAIIVTCLLGLNTLHAQEITLSFANAEVTNDGTDDHYEADIMISSTTDLYVGSGQLYLDYGTSAFGENVAANGNIEYSRPNGSILGHSFGLFSPAYKDFVMNDNTASRVSLSFQQNIALVGLETAPAILQVTGTPKVLLHIKIKYIDSNEDPDICFYSEGVFQDQFYTACGGGGIADCTNAPGTQLLNDTYDCSGAILSSTYTYDNGWSPSDPNGVSTSADDIVIATGNAAITADTDCRTIVVNPGASLTVNTGMTLSTAEGMRLESISTSYSSLILNGTVSGDIAYERHVNSAAGGGTETGNNDLVTPPLSGQTFGAFRAANPNMLSGTIGGSPAFFFGPFNNATGEYVAYNMSDDASVLTAGVGYRTGSTDNGTFTFTGTAENGTVTVPVDASTTSDWYLIGNPYPSYMKVQDFLNDLMNSGLIDESATGLYGYDGAASDGWTIYNLLTVDATTVIAPGQGFFVQAEAAGNITFAPDMRTTGTGDDFILGRSSPLQFLKLGISSNDESYATDLYFNASASLGLDTGYDASLWNGSAPEFSVYSHLVEDSTGVPMAIQALHSDDLYSNVVVPLGVNANGNEQLSFGILESTLPETMKVYLEDTVNGTITLLTQGAYTITPNQDMSGTGRFFLRFEEDALGTLENGLDVLEVYADHKGKAIVVNGLVPGTTRLGLYDLQGRKVLEQNLVVNEMKQSIDVSNLNDGVYVVELNNGNGRKARKLILR